MPSPRSYQSLQIFIPTGYTPARKKPTAKRTATRPGKLFVSASNSKFAPAATTPDTTKTRTGENRSAMESQAYTSVPMTKPNCTAAVIVGRKFCTSGNCSCKAGKTAFTANQREVPANWEKTMVGRRWFFNIG